LTRGWLKAQRCAFRRFVRDPETSRTESVGQPDRMRRRPQALHGPPARRLWTQAGHDDRLLLLCPRRWRWCVGDPSHCRGRHLVPPRSTLGSGTRQLMAKPLPSRKRSAVDRSRVSTATSASKTQLGAEIRLRRDARVAVGLSGAPWLNILGHDSARGGRSISALASRNAGSVLRERYRDRSGLFIGGNKNLRAIEGPRPVLGSPTRRGPQRDMAECAP